MFPASDLAALKTRYNLGTFGSFNLFAAKDSPTVSHHVNINTKCFIICRTWFLLFRRYTRNLVDEGNGKFNLMILCWGEGHSSAIHDHSNAHCFMKILQGSLSEVRFAWPDQSETVEEESELRKISENALQENEVCYINGNQICKWFFCCMKRSRNSVCVISKKTAIPSLLTNLSNFEFRKHFRQSNPRSKPTSQV